MVPIARWMATKLGLPQSDPIAGATLPTNGLGQFDITVPHDRTLKEYKLLVKAPGYETPAVMTKSAAR